MKYEPIDALLDMRLLVHKIQTEADSSKIQGLVIISCQDSEKSCDGIIGCLGEATNALQLIAETLCQHEGVREMVKASLLTAELNRGTLKEYVKQIQDILEYEKEAKINHNHIK